MGTVAKRWSVTLPRASGSRRRNIMLLRKRSVATAPPIQSRWSIACAIHVWQHCRGAARSKQLLQQTTPRAWIFFERMHAHGQSADGVPAARTDVIESDRLLPLGREIQRTRLERVFRSFAIPFFACPDWLLEWRTGDHTGSDSERGRTTSGRNRTAANNGIIAGTRLP